MAQIEKVAERTNFTAGVTRYFLKPIFIVVVFILLLPLIVHLGPVQNWLLDKVTDRISKDTESTVEIDRIKLSFFKGLILEDLFLSEKNNQKDTLMYVGEFSSSLKQNLLSLMDNKLYMRQLKVANAEIKLIKNKGEKRTNLEKFIANFSKESGDGNPSESPLGINLEKLVLDNVHVTIDDYNTNEKLDLSLQKAIIDIQFLSQNNDSLIIDNLLLSDPVVKIEKNVFNTHLIEMTQEDTISKKKVPNENPFFFLVNHVELSRGAFTLDDWNHPNLVSTGPAIDYKHLDISNVNLNADSTTFKIPFEVKSNVKSLTLQEKNGFEIQQLDVKQLTLSDYILKLESFILKTNTSVVQEELEFVFNGFQDFKSFAQKIEINSRLDSSRISLSDLTYFFPELNDSPFFKLNKNKWLELSGSVQGTIDDLNATDLSLAIGNQIKLVGSLNTVDLTDPDRALVNLYVDRLNTSLSSLKNIIPGFSPPDQFYRLGPIQFSGDIDGFFNDFVIFGSLKSDLGKVNLDTRLDIKKGINNANYSGELSLEEFDLQRWTNNPQFGFTTLKASIADGRGLTLNTLYTDLTAELKKFEFKGYSYSDIRLEGELEKNLFNGQFTSNDPNVDFDFDGQINITENSFGSDFEATIRKIDLSAINLSNEITNINGDLQISISGSNSNDIVGSVDVTDLNVRFKDNDYSFDSIYVSSAPGIDKNRNIILYSDFMNASVDGIFDFAELVPSFKNYIYDFHPGWTKILNINERVEGLSNEQNFRYKIEIKDSRNYFELLNLKGLNFAGLGLEGSTNLKNNVFESHIEFDSSRFKDYTFKLFDLELTHKSELSKYKLALNEIESDNKIYDPIEINANINNDELDIQIITKNVLDSVGNIDLTINIIPVESRLKFKIIDKKLQMFSAKWSINPNNELIYGNNFIDLNNFVLTDGYRKINILDFKNRGINTSLENFDFQLINGIINYDKIDFTGEGNADIRIDSIFGKPKIYVGVFVPEFKLNDIDYGSLVVNARDDGADEIFADIKLNRTEDNLSLTVNADYNKNEKSINGELKARNIVMNTFEFIIDDGISNTSGTADIDWKISGKISDIKLKGDAYITNGKTTIDYLGSELSLGKERIRVNENFIDLTNVSLYDRFGNRAIMLGGLKHNLFADFRTKLNISSARFMALETDKFDNPSYYGTGIGELSVDFSGPFSSTDIIVNAITGPGTILNIPVEDTYENFDESFITFIDRNEILNPLTDTLIEAPKLEGVDVEMNLTVTEDAQVNIIFNERLNDIIKGRGNGDLRIIVSREGEFNIYGAYEVVSGDYLFTAWGIVAKPFNVRRGGQITWTGDPINANLKIEAEYAGLRVPTNVFLAEYLVVNPSIEQEAKKRTQVDLKMKLGGTLYKPVINFDISFPELQGELRTYADSKIRTLRENEADLNEQVAGLIMFRSFLPSNSLGDNLITSGSLAQTSYNTVSEFVSNQLSFLLSGLLQEALSENGFVSGIDFEIGFSKSSNLIEDKVEVDNILPDEIEVHFKPRFQNDKWGFDYGTSFVNSSNSIQGITNYVIHDFVIEYYLTKDRRLKLRAYGKWDKDEVEFQNEQKYGVGINYRKEFGSLMDFKKEMSSEISRLTENPEGEEN